MTQLLDLLHTRFLGNSLLHWCLALLAFLVTFTLLPLAKGYIGALRKRRPATESHAVFDVAFLLVHRTTRLFLWSVALWIGAMVLTLPAEFDRIFNRVMLVFLWLQIGIWGVAAAGYFIDRRRVAAPDAGHAGSIAVINFVSRLAIWTFVLLLALDNLDVNITALVTGLGIGGIAVALAVQAVLGDLLASLSIAFDKPFVVGDFLVIDQEMGKVEQIGISNTRLRSVTGEQIIVSNGDLIKARIRNFGRMYERRALFTIGVDYATPREKLRQIPGILEAAIRAQEKTRFERSHFTAFGTYALTFETVYFVLDADYSVYANIQQAINFRIHEELERLGVEFAYPTQRLLLEGGAENRVQPRPA